MTPQIRALVPLHRYLACVLAALTLPGLAAAQSELVIFGDSLSDPGNVYELAHMNATTPYEPVPGAPYAERDGNRFTNGRTWAEQLAGALGVGISGKAALTNPAEHGNYAFGGARAAAGSPTPSSTEQIGLFLSLRGLPAPADGLYVLQFGGNDVRHALETTARAVAEGNYDPTLAPGIVIAAAETIIENVRTLHAAGARRFLIVGTPNLGRAPAIQMAGASAPAMALAGLYNLVLQTGIDGLSTLPGIEIDYLDLYALVEDVVTYPDAYVFDEVHTPCLRFFVVEDAVCKDANKHLFWDGIHPTTRGHAIVAEEALRVLGD